VFDVEIADGVVNDDVAAASFQYVSIVALVLPAVNAAVVISTVAGEHTAAGFVIVSIGVAFTTTFTG
jgi:hypothetical protein